jgi:uncharacterized phage-associated protein
MKYGKADYGAIDIAKCIVNIAIEQADQAVQKLQKIIEIDEVNEKDKIDDIKKDYYVDKLKLQKLLYYAQGCYGVIHNKPLFVDAIVAWKHGPVVESVYHEFSSNKANIISTKQQLSQPNIVPQEVQQFLSNIFELFGQYSSWRLVQMTHNETPWCNTNQSEEIKFGDIVRYFELHYNDAIQFAKLQDKQVIQTIKDFRDSGAFDSMFGAKGLI